MAIMSSRPGIKVKVGVKYPAKIVAISPLTATLSGGTWTFTVDTEGLIGGTCWVWQIKYGLLDFGVYDTVEAGIPPATNTRLNVMWTNGGRTEYGDTLSSLIKTQTGWDNSTLQSFYGYCASILL